MPRLTDRSANPPADGQPADFDSLKSAIADRYDTLSRRLQQVAEFALAHPDDMALETIAVIASRAKVPPSSLIRFSKAMGFDGFTRMQRLFRDRLVTRGTSYAERIQRLSAEPRAGSRPMPSTMLQDAAGACIEGLERLRSDPPVERMERAIEILSRAAVIHVVAQRRAFPVACYLSYLLTELGRPACLLDSVGGMLHQQSRVIAPDAALIAISFQPYSSEVMTLVERCKASGVPLIGITDGPLSPLARLADVGFEIVETEARGFRPLSTVMCLSLTLAVSLGHHIATDA